MNLHIIAGVLLIGAGVAYGVLSLWQAITGRGFWLRQPAIPPSLERAQAGGWVGVAVAAIAVLLGVNQLVPTASAFAGTAALLILALGGVYGLVHRWQRLSRTRYSTRAAIAGPPKYTKLTVRAISAERQAAIEKAVVNIDTLDDIAQLTALLTPAVHSPID
jgi:hypothetical protein